MKKVTVRITMDPLIKFETERILGSMGLTISGAFNLLAHQIINQNRIPFELLGYEEEPNAETLQAMRETEEILANPGAYKSYENLQELVDDLEKDE